MSRPRRIAGIGSEGFLEALRLAGIRLLYGAEDYGKLIGREDVGIVLVEQGLENIAEELRKKGITTILVPGPSSAPVNSDEYYSRILGRTLGISIKLGGERSG